MLWPVRQMVPRAELFICRSAVTVQTLTSDDFHRFVKVAGKQLQQEAPLHAAVPQRTSHAASPNTPNEMTADSVLVS